MFTGKNSSSWRWGGGSQGSLDVEAYPKKIIAMAFLQKSSDIKKSTAANTPSRHHGDVHSHHTLCGLFFTAGYRYTGPYDVPLLRVLNQSHVSPTPWKAQKHQRRFKKLQGALPGQFFSTPKNTKLPQTPPLFQRGEKTWAQATIWTLWFQFTQGDRHSINPCKDLGIYPGRSYPDGRNGWLEVAP